MGELTEVLLSMAWSVPIIILSNFFSVSQSNLIAKDDIVGSPRILKNYKRHSLSNTFTY